MNKVQSIILSIFILFCLVICYIVQANVFDSRIKEQTDILNKTRTVVDEMKQKAHAIDEQSRIDKEYIETVFAKIFTFYNLDDFNRARNTAVNCAMPKDFINSFYDASALTDMYADKMLDVVCQYNSADIYLLDRDEHMSYYYADVQLSMVKFSGIIGLSFFITINNAAIDDKFVSVIYYQNKEQT